MSKVDTIMMSIINKIMVGIPLFVLILIVTFFVSFPEVFFGAIVAMAYIMVTLFSIYLMGCIVSWVLNK